jgi:predicted alpha/beta-hydrolase family hydrolase
MPKAVLNFVSRPGKPTRRRSGHLSGARLLFVIFPGTSVPSGQQNRYRHLPSSLAGSPVSREEDAFPGKRLVVSVF